MHTLLDKDGEEAKIHFIKRLNKQEALYSVNRESIDPFEKLFRPD